MAFIDDVLVEFCGPKQLLNLKTLEEQRNGSVGKNTALPEDLGSVPTLLLQLKTIWNQLSSRGSIHILFWPPRVLHMCGAQIAPAGEAYSHITFLCFLTLHLVKS